MKNKNKIAAKTVLSLLFTLLILSSISLVSAFTPPHRFYGIVTIGGELAPDDTVVTAEIDGVQVESTETFTYGGEKGKYVIDVPGKSGDVITLLVEGTEAAIHSFEEGGFTELNLSVSAPEKATLTVDTTPVKGEVFVDGSSWGTAPQTREVDPGTYTISFGAVSGYTTPSAQTVTLAAGETKSVWGTYETITPPEKATLKVDTTPVKGEVFVNGSSWGTAPQTQSVDPRSYTVSFGSVSGYTTPSAQTVTLVAGETKTVLGTYEAVTPPPNQPPTADAGGPYSVDEGETVELDGTKSSDPDGDTLTYSWTITNDPTGEASLSDSDTAIPTFNAPSVASNTDVTVELTVDDGHGHTDSDTATVTVQNVPPPNQPPTADAGGPYSVDEDETVELDGKGSSDPDGDALTYSWTITNDPTGEASLTDADTSTPTFHAPTVDSATDVTVELTVDDGHGHTDSDVATVTVEPAVPPVNQPPTADANGPYSVDEEKTVKLDGTGSSDPDGDTLTYSWTITVDPTGESSLTNSSTATPTFHAPAVDSDTNVTVKLTVDDGHGHTDSDTAAVTVKAVAPPPEFPWPAVLAIIIIVIVIVAICYWKREEISRRLRKA